MPRTVLHLLSQRPSRTGSGVTVEALAREAARAGWRQAAVVGVPADDPAPPVGDLPAAAVHPLVFGRGPLPFPVPGMSDVMPYPSTRFSAMTVGELAAYRAAWREHLARVIDAVRPDVIHAHHVWLMTSLVKDVAPDLPVVAHCHATGLRQRALCPHLADEVARGCARVDRFVTLHRGVAAELATALGVPPDRIHVVGAGYREDLFHREGRLDVPRTALLYVGKYSASKGLPSLLDAVCRLAPAHPGLTLHVAGSGAGPEAEALRARMEALAATARADPSDPSAPRVVLHGALPQPALADLMRACHALVLPSFYEGVPLVLAEGLASGCRLVATALPGVVDQLAPHLGDALTLVAPPRLVGVDVPDPAELPAFEHRLAGALANALSAPPLTGDLAPRLAPFTWAAVFARVEALWRELLGL